MKQTSHLLKLAAVASSLLLAVGFVSYRAGAFGWIMGSGDSSSAPGMIGGSKSKVLIETPAPRAPDLQFQGTVEGDLTIMSGSKSFMLAVPPSDTSRAKTQAESQLPPAATPTKPTIMSGSKAPFLPLIELPETEFPQSRPSPTTQPGKPTP